MPVVRLPAVLDPATAGRRRIEVSGATLGAVLNDLCKQIPTLRVHLFDPQGALRRHVICVLDGYTRRRLDTAVAPDDEIVVLQAVSGG